MAYNKGFGVTIHQFLRMSTLAKLYKRPSDKICPEDISHLVGDGNYVHIYFVDGSKATFSRTLKQCHAEPPHLIRITKSLLINPACVTDWKRSGATTMRITVAGTDYQVSRRRVSAVMALLTETIIYQRSLPACV